MSINIAKQVESGRTDLAFVPSVIFPSNVESEQILVEDLALGGAKGADGDTDAPIEFEAASRFPLVLPTRPHYVRNTLEQAAFDRGLHLNVKVEQDSARLLPRIVKIRFRLFDFTGETLFSKTWAFEISSRARSSIRKCPGPCTSSGRKRRRATGRRPGSATSLETSSSSYPRRAGYAANCRSSRLRSCSNTARVVLLFPGSTGPGILFPRKDRILAGDTQNHGRPPEHHLHHVRPAARRLLRIRREQDKDTAPRPHGGGGDTFQRLHHAEPCVPAVAGVDPDRAAAANPRRRRQRHRPQARGWGGRLSGAIERSRLPDRLHRQGAFRDLQHFPAHRYAGMQNELRQVRAGLVLVLTWGSAMSS